MLASSAAALLLVLAVGATVAGIWAYKSQQEAVLANAVFSALRDARMRALPHHMDWVVRLIGPERVCKCPSLPQAIRELAERAKS